jgi:hypothetical protein
MSKIFFYLEYIVFVSEEIVGMQCYKTNFKGGNSTISGINIKVYNKNDTTTYIMISYKENEYYSGSGFDGYEDYTKAEIFNFTDTLTYILTLDKTSNVLPLTKVSSGYHSTSSYIKKSNKSRKTDCYIYCISNSDILLKKSLIVERCYYIIVYSDDLTNFSKPIILTSSSTILGFSLQRKIFEWRDDKLNNFCFNSTVAANWTLNNKFFLLTLKVIKC